MVLCLLDLPQVTHPLLAAWVLPKLQMEHHDLVEPSVPSKMHKVDCPLVGREGRIIWEEPTMWIIIQGPQAGIDRLLLELRRHNEMSEMQTHKLSVKDIKIGPYQKIEMAPIHQIFNSSNKPVEMLQTQLQWWLLEPQRRELVSFRLYGNRDILLKVVLTSLIIIREPRRGLIREDSNTSVCMEDLHRTATPFNNSLCHNLAHCPADGKWDLPTRPECTSWITIRKPQHGTIQDCHLRWIKMYHSTSAISDASLSTSDRNLRYASYLVNAMSRFGDLTSLRTHMLRLWGSPQRIWRNV